jgi:hypothetical protein
LRIYLISETADADSFSRILTVASGGSVLLPTAIFSPIARARGLQTEVSRFPLLEGDYPDFSTKFDKDRRRNQNPSGYVVEQKTSVSAVLYTPIRNKC